MSDDVSIFPNPVQHTANIQVNRSFDDAVQIEIRDQYGKTVQSVSDAVIHEGSYPMNLQGIPNGIYTLSVQSKKGVTTKRFVINH